jgi:hypothetical protein
VVAAAAKAKVDVMRTTKAAVMMVWIVLFIVVPSRFVCAAIQ